MEINLDNELPETFRELMYNEDRFLFLGGTAGSGKSVFAVKKTVVRCLENPETILVLRKVQKTVKRSIFQEYKRCIETWKLGEIYYYHANNSELTIWLNESIILFTGMDDQEKLKSISGVTSAVMEELTEFDQNDLDQVSLRIRGKTPSYKQIIGMYNRIDEEHWLKALEDSKDLHHTTIHSSSYLDNPFIDKEYKDYLESYRLTNKYFYEVYTLGLWGQMSKANKFLYSFDRDKHIKKCIIDENLPLKLSFDFNLEPFAVIAYQMEDDCMRVVDKIRLDDSDIYAVCDHIKAKFQGLLFSVTGDRTGYNRTGTVRGKTSYWHIIKKELSLSDAQIKLRNKNLDLLSSRILCNSALLHKDIIIDPDVTELIRDCNYATVDNFGELLKDRNKNQNDFLDCLRYAIDSEYPTLHLIKH